MLRLNHWMIKAAAQKLLSLLPGGRVGNAFFQQYVTRTLALDTARFEEAVLQCRRHLENYFAIAGRSTGFTVFELGSGWHPILPIGMYLCGASHLTTLDIQPGFTAKRVRDVLQSYCQYAENGRLESLLPWVDRGRVRFLLEVLRDSRLRSVADLLCPMDISAKVGDVRDVKLDSEAIDFFFSNGVLQHVPADVIRDMLGHFRRLAAPNAVMSHYICLGDLYVGFDPGITPYNFLRFSRRVWRLIDNSLKPHNRLRVSDYCRLHSEIGWKMEVEDNTLGCLEDFRKIPLATQFQHYSPHDLLAISSWLTSRCDKSIAPAELRLKPDQRSRYEAGTVSRLASRDICVRPSADNDV
jgi:hypothetical protein